jgi:RNA polymerase sigma-70 factor, ECF subfamily
MSMSQTIHGEILESLPKMRGYARRLTRDHAAADDLVQTAVMRALTYAHLYQPNSNFGAWIGTILKNSYFNEVRALTRRPTVALDLVPTGTSGGQEGRLLMRDLGRAFERLPSDQQQALMLIAVDGLSYEDAGDVAGVPAGTIKSRVSRARHQLQQSLDWHPANRRPSPLPPMRRSARHEPVALHADIGAGDFAARGPQAVMAPSGWNVS